MIYNQILSERERLYKQLQTLKTLVKSYPDGDLLCAKNGKYAKCYLLNNDGSCPTYIPKGNQQLVESLAAKKYYTLQISELTKEIAVLDKCLTQYKKIRIKSEALLDESSCYKKFLRPIICTTSDKINQWLSANHEHNLSHPEHLIHKTMSGIYVRSKSEVIIANALYTNNIPFLYECGLSLNDTLIFPDFTICHPNTLEIFYWEHFGLMDSKSYCDSTFTKLKHYSNHGIIPDINLITTYETQNHPIDSEKIHKIIQNFFLG